MFEGLHLHWKKEKRTTGGGWPQKPNRTIRSTQSMLVTFRIRVDLSGKG